MPIHKPHRPPTELDELVDHFAARFGERLPKIDYAGRRELARRMLRGLGAFSARGDIVLDDMPRRPVIR